MGAHCYYFQQKRIQMTFFVQENELKNIHEHFPTFDQKQQLQKKRAIIIEHTF